MEGTLNIGEVTIPAEVLTGSTVTAITFVPQDKIVKLTVNDSNNIIRDITADMTDEWVALSTTKKTDFKAIMKKVVAIAFGTTAGEITGEIWD